MERAKVFDIEPLGFQWKASDPFLFCVHHEDYYPAGNSHLGPDPAELHGRQIGQDFTLRDGWRMYHGQKVPGFPSHPHRGFETVTVVRKGVVDHSDSLGAAGRYAHGDVQWMTAGKGIQHAEMFPLLNSDSENTLELFQIWLNLPAKSKFAEPHFKMLWSESIPIYKSQDASGRTSKIEIIAGSVEAEKAPAPPPDSWAADLENEVSIWNIQMEAGAKWIIPKASAGINRRIYFYRGKQVRIDGKEIKPYHSAQLIPEIALEIEAGSEDCSILVLQGRPIGEPVAQHGPFVMNSQAEIQQTFEDYQQTSFGGWPWPTSEPVHHPAQSRFARHADGSMEEPK